MTDKFISKKFLLLLILTNFLLVESWSMVNYYLYHDWVFSEVSRANFIGRVANDREYWANYSPKVSDPQIVKDAAIIINNLPKNDVVTPGVLIKEQLHYPRYTKETVLLYNQIYFHRLGYQLSLSLKNIGNSLFGQAWSPVDLDFLKNSNKLLWGLFLIGNKIKHLLSFIIIVFPILFISAIRKRNYNQVHILSLLTLIIIYMHATTALSAYCDIARLSAPAEALFSILIAYCLCEILKFIKKRISLFSA